MRRKILTGLFWILGLGVVLWWSRLPSTKLTAGHPIPAALLADAEGHVVSLNDFHGKVLLINFWATWCPPCVEEMPQLEGLSQDFKNKNFVLLGINENGGTTSKAREAVAAFRLRVPLSFPILFDDKEVAADGFGVTSLPTSFLVDKTGNIVKVISGSVNWMDPHTLKIIEELL